MQSFLSKFNIKLLIIHFVAFWLFIFAFRTLAFLYDFDFFINSPVGARMKDMARTDFDITIIKQAGFLGAIVGYVISWRISLKRNWFWLNSVLIFALIYILKFFDVLGWSQLQKVFLLPGQILGLPPRAFYIVNGLFMLALGCFLLFSKKIQQFIDGKGAEKGKVTRKAKPAKTKG